MREKKKKKKIDFILTLVGCLENRNVREMYIMSPPKDTSCCWPSLAVSKTSQRITARIRQPHITLRKPGRMLWHHFLCYLGNLNQA